MHDVMAEFHDGPHATPPPAVEGPVFLGIKNISDAGALDLRSIRHIAEEDFVKWTRRVVPQEGDVVFTYEATLHRYALIPKGFRGCLGRRVALIRPDRNVVIPRFLHFAMLGPAWRATVTDRIISGATVDRVPLVDFPAFPIRLPGMRTQQAVLEVLAAMDDLIGNNQRRLQILEDMVRSTYREWFVHFRFPRHESAVFVDSPIGSIPEGWQVATAADVLIVNPRVKVDAQAEHPFITMADLREHSLICLPSDVRRGNSGSKFQNGDTLFARITPCLENGKTGLVQCLEPSQVGRGSTEFVVLRGRVVGPAFTYCLARSEDFRANAIQSMSGASGRQRVRNECFGSYRFAVPPAELVGHFEEIATPLLKSVHALTLEAAQLASLRDFVLPKLVTGQIDVSSDLESMVENSVA